MSNAVISVENLGKRYSLGPGGRTNERYTALRDVIARGAAAPFKRLKEKFEPDHTFWPQLLNVLPPSPPPKSGVLPHPTRFVAMSGITRRGRETVVEWIRPISAHG